MYTALLLPDFANLFLSLKSDRNLAWAVKMERRPVYGRIYKNGGPGHSDPQSGKHGAPTQEDRYLGPSSPG